MATSKEKVRVPSPIKRVRRASKKDIVHEDTYSINGKWSYQESYEGGYTKGELILNQKGKKLSGKMLFNDYCEGNEPYMMQEMVAGVIENRKVKIEAFDYDIIDAQLPSDFRYELDSWLGILVDDDTIIGTSVDYQGIGGEFVLKRIKD